MYDVLIHGKDEFTFTVTTNVDAKEGQFETREFENWAHIKIFELD